MRCLGPAPTSAVGVDRADLGGRDVCALDDIVPELRRRGADRRPPDRAGARRARATRCYALSNYDPFSEAFVIARGIVGDRAGRPKIASPIFKQTFDLQTGACLDDPAVSLPTYPVRVARRPRRGGAGSGRHHMKAPTSAPVRGDAFRTGCSSCRPSPSLCCSLCG